MRQSLVGDSPVVETRLRVPERRRSAPRLRRTRARRRGRGGGGGAQRVEDPVRGGPGRPPVPGRRRRPSRDGRTWTGPRCASTERWRWCWPGRRDGSPCRRRRRRRRRDRVRRRGGVGAPGGGPLRARARATASAAVPARPHRDPAGGAARLPGAPAPRPRRCPAPSRWPRGGRPQAERRPLRGPRPTPPSSRRGQRAIPPARGPRGPRRQPRSTCSASPTRPRLSSPPGKRPGRSSMHPVARRRPSRALAPHPRRRHRRGAGARPWHRLVPVLAHADPADRARAEAALPSLAAMLDAIGESRAAADVRRLPWRPPGADRRPVRRSRRAGWPAASTTWTWPGQAAESGPGGQRRPRHRSPASVSWTTTAQGWR